MATAADSTERRDALVGRLFMNAIGAARPSHGAFETKRPSPLRSRWKSVLRAAARCAPAPRVYGPGIRNRAAFEHEHPAVQIGGGAGMIRHDA
jgi:hypothetical protein